MQPWMIAAALIGGYLLGSIPFGVIAMRIGGEGDIRKVGSGNIGATNVLRTGRKDLALITLIGDGAKGALAVLIAYLLWKQPVLTALAGGAAFAGHLFPVWLKFNGGKGVATFLGVLLAVCWPAGLAACATWLICAKLFKISSLSALIAVALSPLYVLYAGHLLQHRDHSFVVLAVFMAVLVFIRHHENIRRLLKGEEPRIGAKK